MSELDTKKEILSTLKNYLTGFIPGVEDIINLFRIGKEAEALSFMKDAIDGLQWIYDAVVLTQDIQVKKIEVSSIGPFFVEMVDALESMDYILLGDLLEYEIIPILKQWQEELL